MRDRDKKIYVPFRDIFLIISFASSGETAIKRTHFSAADPIIQLQKILVIETINTIT